MIFAFWHPIPNWGDAVNPVLIKAFTGEQAVNVAGHMNRKSRLLSVPKRLMQHAQHAPIYMVCGSILGWAGRDTVVWGAGFIKEDAQTREEPQRICAVRGKLSRDKLVEQGWSCPKIYGDPALLFSKIYPKCTPQKYGLGIIPHYVDYEAAKKIFGDQSDVKLIDVNRGIYNVADEVLECEKIASSSLHGLVLADSYRIPNLWLRFGDNIIGGDYKFLDYFSGVSRKTCLPLFVDERTSLEDVYGSFTKDAPKININGLAESCPFK